MILFYSNKCVLKEGFYLIRKELDFLLFIVLFLYNSGRGDYASFSFPTGYSSEHKL